MICYAFPVAHEAELLLKKCTQRESFNIDKMPCTLANLGTRQVLIAGIGLGQARARENTQNADGSWTEDHITGTGFPKVFYLKYDMYRNNWPLLALADFQRLAAGRDRVAAK